MSVASSRFLRHRDPLPQASAVRLAGGGHHHGMGLFRRSPRVATVHNRPLHCLICGGQEFWDREVKLNSTGLELLDLGWANRSALGLICAHCGFVHEFVGDAVRLRKQPKIDTRRHD